MNTVLQLSDGYRAGRRNLAVFCALALAWSAAQFEIRALNVAFLGEVDLSRASIPLILFCVVAYSLFRLALEYAMQAVEIRRWSYAQIDFKTSLFLARVTIVVLPASILDRSLYTIIYVIIGGGIILSLASVATFIATMLIMPVMLYVRSRQGRHGVAARAIESVAWAQIVVVFTLIVGLIVLGVASVIYQPLASVWTTPPSPFAIIFFVIGCIVVIVSIYTEDVWSNKLFAMPPPFTDRRLPDGRLVRSFLPLPEDVWDWYIQPENKDIKDKLDE